MVKARKEFNSSVLEYPLKRCEELGRNESETSLTAKQEDFGGDGAITVHGPIVEGDLLLVFGNTSFEQWFHLPPFAPTDRETEDSIGRTIAASSQSGQGQNRHRGPYMQRHRESPQRRAVLGNCGIHPTRMEPLTDIPGSYTATRENTVVAPGGFESHEASIAMTENGRCARSGLNGEKVFAFPVDAVARTQWPASTMSSTVDDMDGEALSPNSRAKGR